MQAIVVCCYAPAIIVVIILDMIGTAYTFSREQRKRKKTEKNSSTYCSCSFYCCCTWYVWILIVPTWYIGRAAVALRYVNTHLLMLYVSPFYSAGSRRTIYPEILRLGTRKSLPMYTQQYTRIFPLQQPESVWILAGRVSYPFYDGGP